MFRKALETAVKFYPAPRSDHLVGPQACARGGTVGSEAGDHHDLENILIKYIPAEWTR